MEAPTRRKLVRGIWIASAVVAYALLTYVPDYGWWWSLVGSAAILSCARLAWPQGWTRLAGLRLPKRDALLLAPLFLLGLAAAFAIAHVAARASGVGLVPVFESDQVATRMFHTAGQTVNEELVLGAFLLAGVSRWLGRTRWITISVGVALVFALLHLGFYALRPAVDRNYGVLSSAALAALFCAGVLRNNLILSYGHVGFSWALHYAFNLVVFQSRFAQEDGRLLNEPQCFDVLLGSGVAILVIAGAMVVTGVLGRRALLAGGAPWPEP